MDSLDELVALHRSGTLHGRYPDVAGLLAAVPEADLTRAGQLLSSMDAEKLRAEYPRIPTIRVAITGNGLLTGLVAPLTAETARHGLVLVPRTGDFGGYLTDLSEPGSTLLAEHPDLVLCVLDHQVVFDEVPAPWRVEDAERALTAVLSRVRTIADRFAGGDLGTLVLNTLPLPRTVLHQLVDHRSRARLGAVWREANAALLRLVETHADVLVVDVDALLTEEGALSDPRLSTYVHAQFSPALLARYAREVGHLARHTYGRTKKCLVLDLDDTVWGGILSEAGPEGIEVAGTYRGEAFRAFQQLVRQLAAQGVLIAAVSKNDPEPVRQVLTGHPEMTLTETDFVRVIANWRPKHDNLAELARQLNLGVDSMVFVDDSAFECGLIRRELPAVAVVQLDAEPALHGTRLLRDGWFDAVRVTDEDRARTGAYRTELARTDFLQQFDSIADYLRELELWVRFEPAEPRQIGRVSQLTLRTNQFNLTTVRLQESEVARLTEDPDTDVYTIRSGDRFGDNGLVGAVFLRRDGDTVLIENFLLSCRVFARGIEQACLSQVLRQARETGAAEVVGTYRPTAKNTKVADLYARHGFAEEPGSGPDRQFRHRLGDITPAPEHIRMVAKEEPFR